MNFIAIIFTILGILVHVKAYNQDLSAHRWKDRLLLVITEDSLKNEFISQLELFRSDDAGMLDRRLVVYQVTPGHFKQGLEADQWNPSGSLFKQYRSARSDLETVLIGLDGGIKARYEGPVGLADIYSRIDAMPMRKRELDGR